MHFSSRYLCYHNGIVRISREYYKNMFVYSRQQQLMFSTLNINYTSPRRHIFHDELNPRVCNLFLHFTSLLSHWFLMKSYFKDVHFHKMNLLLVPPFLCISVPVFILELSNSFITLNKVLIHPLLMAKQMAAHNTFLLSDRFDYSHWWPRKWPLDLHGGASKWDDEHCINPSGLPACGHRWCKAITNMVLNSQSTLKIKGRVCVFSDGIGIGKGQLFHWYIGLGCVQDTLAAMKVSGWRST